MRNDERIRRVEFIDAGMFDAYKKLCKGSFEEKQLAEQIERVIDELKKNPLLGVIVPRDLWPKEYVKRYSITNLRKYDLPKGWRLIYTLVGNEVEIISIILEWFDHKGYALRFGYKKR